ncbi:MAG TPA: 2-oxoglutarate dehydrogenase, E2 component, dihydrolipoamide succinyltransferase [Candidatus Kapabacteria bacterium]|nr:2-oxoglutarate dehydrogenase, E2 component, dihydrolipoamide succinyltransferase [Candidatus Kapabacteria bacterium]
MATNVVMPKMGESITEGTILRWLKKPGDAVKKDEPILEISTDKVDTEVPAPFAGVLLEQLVEEKQTVAVGTPIAVIGESGEKAIASPVTKTESKPAPAPAPVAPVAPVAPSAPAPKTNGAVTASANEQAVVMPKMGESITEGTILRWLKKPGDAIKKDEPILEISTDKVDTEVPSPIAGILTKILANEKQVVPVGDVLAYIAGTGAATPSVSSAPIAVPQAAPAQTMASVPQFIIGTPAVSARNSSGRFYSPLVRSIAKTENISLAELDQISGSGLGGRVNKNDILGFISNRKSGKTAAPASSGVAIKSTPISNTPTVTFASDTVIPMDNIRQKIAEHMVRSVHTSAHVTSVSEADVTAIVKFREKFKDEFKRREGLNLTYTPIFIEAMIRAIKDFPFINAQLDGTNILVKKDINFGVAVGVPPSENSPLPPALIVPVIKQAQNLNYIGIAHAVSNLAVKARTKKLTPDDISGGTFTITNPGMYGNLFGTPIINQPQIAIMTTGAVVKKPVVKTDENGDDYIAIRSMMYLGLSYDHRLIDGMYGVQFTERVKYYLENFQLDML